MVKRENKAEIAEVKSFLENDQYYLMTGKAWSDYINTIVQTVHYFKLSGVPALNLFKGLPHTRRFAGTFGKTDIVLMNL